MLRDRGNIKWTAMMLPEHVSLLRELEQRHFYKEKPVLDDQELEVMNSKIARSMELNEQVQITYFEEHDYKNIVGFIRRYNTLNKCLEIVLDEYNSCLKLKLCDVINIEIFELC